MRKAAIILIMVLVFTAFVFFNTAPAEEGEVINDACPVMGGKVDKDTPYKTEYKGQTIGFCCPGCIEKFKADPEKYIAKIQKAPKKCIIKCPECGAEIDVMKQCKNLRASCPAMKEAE